MLFVELDEATRISGYLGIISLFVVLLISTLVLTRAIHRKNKLLYIFFIVVLLTPSPWYPSNFEFIYWLITGNTFDYHIYMLIGTIGLPIALLGWIYIYMTTLKPERTKLILTIYIIFSIFYHVYLFYFLYLAPDAPVERMLGNKTGPLNMIHKGLIIIYFMVALTTATITGIHFSLVSMRSDVREVRWKGKFLLISFILFGIGAVGDGFFEVAPIHMFIFRTLLTISSVFYYVGFVMPSWMKGILSLD